MPIKPDVQTYLTRQAHLDRVVMAKMEVIKAEEHWKDMVNAARAAGISDTDIQAASHVAERILK